MNKLPQAKTENIVVQDLRDELLVYNLTTHQAFTLNETLKIVYEVCDGNTTFGELKRRYQFTDDFVHLALDELRTNDLLIDYPCNYFKGMSRRDAFRKVGLVSMAALPIISSLVAPEAAAAQSTVCNRSNADVITTVANTTCANYSGGSCANYCARIGDSRSNCVNNSDNSASCACCR